jgi:tetratricopeptide (TPR) repeat protein
MATTPAFAQPECARLPPGQFGPFDYRTQRAKLAVVELNHFTPEVEQLIKGRSSDFIENDIQFVLIYYPNHYRALEAMARLSLRKRTLKLRHAALPTECYFVNAMRFAPDDPKVRLGYGVYLSRIGQSAAALTQFQEAEKLGATDANTYYNLGLMYFDMKDYGKAVEYAKKAYDLGFPLPGLRKKLEQAGKWDQ